MQKVIYTHTHQDTFDPIVHPPDPLALSIPLSLSLPLVRPFSKHKIKITICQNVNFRTAHLNFIVARNYIREARP